LNQAIIALLSHRIGSHFVLPIRRQVASYFVVDHDFSRFY